jgi:hypothetical protein
MITIENLTNPGVDPVNEDQIKIFHDSGAVEIVEFNSTLLNQYKTNRIAEIKSDAFQRISAIDWKVDRIKEQFELGLTTESGIEEVYNERQTIRTNSNQAESYINSSTTISGIVGFTW